MALVPRCGAAHLASLPRSDRKSTRLNSSHTVISYAVFCLKKEDDTRVHHVLRDVACGLLRPVYNYLDDLVALEGTPKPILQRKNLKRVLKAVSSFDACRGC